LGAETVFNKGRTSLKVCFPQCDMPTLRAEGRKYFVQEGDQSRYYSVHG
jgi:hypothetical protein